ncbi:toll-like receptor 3 [Mercenaria mercenaria]|uniref:toll-like receptor 3 n=1 Tax=Mercenaria mercenaria TaxID=6596 RepID=UPI00234E6B95|nr:toll-like receptor 3 [Mercenaria mercenaria]
MTVKLHEETERTLSELNVSNNGLEYLSPLTLKPSENVRILDLSNNKLSVMQEKYTKDFENLFWAQTKLHYLNFSHNSLSKIPMQTFSKNKHLKVLDISYNNIESLDFAVKQLVNIEKLIVSHNRIYTIEYDFRIDLQMLLSRLSNSTLDGNDIFYVYLEGNPFECTCDKGNMRFLEWLHATDIIDENETLTCNLDENLVDVRGNGLAETKHFCRMQNLQKIASISTPLVSAAVIICIIFVFLLNRRHRRKLIIREVVAQIEMGIFPLQHLAFLSHCSEDTDLVMSKIYPELCEHLSEITRSKEELVCIGDRHFRPGFALREEVMRCVENSSVFLAIISRNFCRKAWCNLEIGEAYDQNKPIIMLMTEHVEKELMDYLLQKMFDRYTHATWIPDDNGGHVEPEWKIFCNSIIQLAGKSTEKHVKTPAEKKCLINSTYRS